MSLICHLAGRYWISGAGARDKREPTGLAEPELSGVTAWRSFESPPEARWLWVQAVPLANESDVEAALQEVWTRTIKNLRANVRLVREREEPQLNGVGSANRTLEQTTEGPIGPGVVRLAVQYQD